MQNDAHRDDPQGATTCPNCGSMMPTEMRFCRACGCRMGEGVEEYNETVRFADAPQTGRRGRVKTAAARAAATLPANSKEFREVAGRVHEQTVKSVTGGLGRLKPLSSACRRMPRWMLWVLIPLLVIILTNGLFSPSTQRIRNRNKDREAAVAPSASNSFLGSHYRTDLGGAFLEDVTPPGSTADKAGLVGGDVITSFDGKPVKSEDDLTELLTNTPPGKTIEVTYLRDGETKTAKLVTISEEENSRLEEAFEDRPQPKGFMGVDEMERVQIPGTKIYGVRVNEVLKNRPAYTADMHDGDIIIELDKTPIRTEEELNRRIARALPGSVVNVVVMRGAERLEIPVKMGER